MSRIATLASIRANHMVVGSTYTMSAWKKGTENPTVEFLGFFDGEDKLVANPAVLKNMAQDWTMKVRDTTSGEETVITKDPDGFGAMFVGKTRITFFQTEEQAQAIKEAKAAAAEATKAAKAAEREAAKAAKAAEKATTEDAPKKKRGRPAKTKPEIVQVTETTEEAAPAE